MKGKGVLIDSGPLVAMLNERDQHYTVCVEQAKNLRGPFHTSWSVVTEAAHLLKSEADAVQSLLAWVRTGEIQIIQLAARDADGIARILRRYSDQNFGFADATLMHLAEREAIQTVFTIDRRHFSVYRTNRRKALSLVPAAP